jgi:hypothetical protein
MMRAMSRSRPTVREIYFGEAPGTAREQADWEYAFFTRVRLRNGVSKATTIRRLDDLNRLVLGLLPPDRPLELMDVAASSGVSTLEWSESLTEAGIAHRMVAGDASARAWLVSVGPLFEALCDRNGYPLHFDVSGRGLPNGGESPLLSLPIHALRALFQAVLWTHPGLRRSLASGDGHYRAGGVSSRPIVLVSPRLLTRTDLTVLDDDILRGQDPTLRRRFHALRAANILNHAYFDPATLARSVENLRERLRDGGLFVVCRTSSDGANHGTVFQLRQGRRFAALARLGRGSEIEELVLGL